MPRGQAQELTTVRPRPGFNPAFEETGGELRSLARAPDGKIYAGGSFTRFAGSERTALVRLNADGSWDPTAEQLERFSWVDRLLFDTEGRLLVTGTHLDAGKPGRSGLFRLNADGSLDATFATVSGGVAIAVQTDGRILVGGDVVVNGVSRPGLGRLNADGTLDTTFTPGLWASGGVAAIAVQPDGRILIGGDFSTVGGMPYKYIARLQPNGEPDTTFSSGTGFSSVVRAIVVQEDGKILVGGSFSTYRSELSRGLIRLNEDGSRDTTFLLPPDALRGGVSAISLKQDGTILAAGAFSIVDGSAVNMVVRLSADGAIDSTLAAPPTIDRYTRGTATSFLELVDGRLLVAGRFDTAGASWDVRGGTVHSGIMRLSSTGTLDETYAPEVRRTSLVRAVYAMPDGGWLVSGDFDFVDSTPRAGIARVSAAGVVDAGFDPAPKFDVAPTCLLVQPDGKVLASGAFTSFGGTSAGRIVRLLADGSRDTTFHTGTGFDDVVNSIVLTSGGKIVAGGKFNTYDGTPRMRLARLLSDGTLDASFDPGTGPTYDSGPSGVTQLATHPDGRVVVNGYFNAYQGEPRLNMVQLLSTGAIDPVFNTGTLFQFSRPEFLLPAPGGKVYVGATGFMMPPVNAYIARLNADGTLDATFDADTGRPGPLGPLQADGKLFVPGDVFGPGGSYSYFMRVSTTGALDPSFYAPGMISITALGADLSADGNVALAGSWGTFDDFEGRGLVLLENAAVPVVTSPSLQGGRLGEPFSCDVAASGSPTQYAAALPAGLSIHPATGRISGTPRTAGRFSIRITARNAAGTGGAWMSLSLQPGTASVSFPVSALAYNGQPRPVSVETDPVGLRALVSYDGSTVAPTAQGTYPLSAVIQDNNYTGSGTGTLRILPPIEAVTGNVVTTPAGTATELAITYAGNPTAYQWQLRQPATNDSPAAWVDVPGAVSAKLKLLSPQRFGPSAYRILIRDGVDWIAGEPIQLAIEEPAPSTARVMNLSTRALDLTGDNLLIPGFVISGTGTKRILVRAVGPGLFDMFGLQGYLADPQLSLRNQDTGAQIAANDDWGTSADKAAIITTSESVGAFPLLESSKDSVLVVDLPAGHYTAPAVGAAGGTGIAMVELYDADPDNTGGARLVNISNRGFVDVGDKIMIPGFVVSNEGSRTFLIRAVGPGLRSTFGLQGILEDPVLTVFNSAGQPILNNDDWDRIAGSTKTYSTAAQVGAFPLVAGSTDAAFVVTLPPGGYTIQATGKAGTTGVALVEVYLVP